MHLSILNVCTAFFLWCALTKKCTFTLRMLISAAEESNHWYLTPYCKFRCLLFPDKANRARVQVEALFSDSPHHLIYSWHISGLCQLALLEEESGHISEDPKGQWLGPSVIWMKAPLAEKGWVQPH